MPRPPASKTLERATLGEACAAGWVAGLIGDRDFSDLAFKTVPTREVTAADRKYMLALFDANYRQANHAYLEKSLQRLRYVSLAERDGEPAGFGLGDAVVVDLPRLARETLVLGGLCCIAPEFRRRGLFGELQRRSVLAASPPPSERILMCGRMAHPAALRLVAVNDSVVPKPGMAPTLWQQQVGQAVADVYGVESFDSHTFVCKGTGRPIGFPVIEIDVEPGEWEVFRPVDRERGDSLLGIAWSPDAPAGWEDP